jgi:hypothetical protein
VPPAVIVTFGAPPEAVVNATLSATATMLAVAGVWLDACPPISRAPMTAATAMNGTERFRVLTGAHHPPPKGAAQPAPSEPAAPARYDAPMEGFGGLFGDPEELQRRMAEFAESMQAQQGLVWADNAIKLAVEMTVAAINRVNIQGTVEQQAEQIRAVMATVFPDAVALVREARSGLQ